MRRGAPAWRTTACSTKRHGNCRWHHQWIVLHEFLPALVGQSVADQMLPFGIYGDLRSSSVNVGVRRKTGFSSSTPDKNRTTRKLTSRPQDQFGGSRFFLRAFRRPSLVPLQRRACAFLLAPRPLRVLQCAIGVRKDLQNCRIGHRRTDPLQALSPSCRL